MAFTLGVSERSSFCIVMVFRSGSHWAYQNAIGRATWSMHCTCRILLDIDENTSARPWLSLYDT